MLSSLILRHENNQLPPMPTVTGLYGLALVGDTVLVVRHF
jgi:hypothetical protein